MSSFSMMVAAISQLLVFLLTSVVMMLSLPQLTPSKADRVRAHDQDEEDSLFTLAPQGPESDRSARIGRGNALVSPSERRATQNVKRLAWAMSELAVNEAVNSVLARRRYHAQRLERVRHADKRKEREISRMAAVAAGFRKLIVNNEDNAAAVEQILDDYVTQKYSLPDGVSQIDPEYVYQENELARIRLGNRLMTEIPSVQGVILLKELFL